MAESLVSNIGSQLANLLIQEAATLRGVRDQIEWVKTELHLLQGFLKDAESRRTRGDERMESWIREKRGVAYEVEDIIDRVKFMAVRQRRRRGFMGKISRYYHKPGELITLHKIGSEIGKMEQKIQNISLSKDRYGIAGLDESSTAVVEISQSLRESSRYSDDDDIDAIGFENDKTKLVSQLLDRNEKARCVISIVGMGGLGKTTLARKVYNDPAIKKHFDTSAWVSVSQSYRVIELAKDIMKQVMRNKKKEETTTGVTVEGLEQQMGEEDEREELRDFNTFAWVSGSQNYRVIELAKDIMKKVMGIKKKKETTRGITVKELEQMGEEEVREKLRDFLRDRKYLVVMDDVWSVDVWRQMHSFFPNGNNGSTILLTTRNIEVARDAEPWIPPHELQLLNDAQSLELFRRKAFPPNQDVPTDLKELAQKLAKKCGGLPLALVVLGGLLSRKGSSHDAWWRVDQSMNWVSTRDGKDCLNILGLSYKDLPCLLKSCFLYIAAFPEDSEISASKLVRLWVVEGFILQQQRQTMEDTARDWLDELVQRCMIQVVKRSVACGRVKSIRIHDLLRDFGLAEAKKHNILHVCSSDNMAVSDGISSHRAAFYNRINDEVAVSSPHLRTLLGFKLDSTAAGRFLNGLNLLRVLDLEDAKNLTELSERIDSMIHLRYLGLRNTGLKRLPSSIRHLLNLQTLDVRGTNIDRLPKSFWKIQTLRHVYINIDAFLSAPISGDHNNLQTLQIRKCNKVVRSPGTTFTKNLATTPSGAREASYKKIDRTFKKSLEKALAKMNGLVSLSLSLDSTIIPVDVLFDRDRAPNMHQLRSLIMDGRLLLDQRHQLPDSSQFPPNLTKLKLSLSFLEQDPMPVLEKLQNLKFLKLKKSAYVGRSMVCSSAGGFPRLQHLKLQNLPDLDEWKVENGAMPSLTHLTINLCAKLKMLPEGLQQVTTLRDLKLDLMPRAFNDRVRNADNYKVQHIASINYQPW